MTIEEKITRAKSDYDAVYEAGKSQGGGKPTLYGTYAIKEDAMAMEEVGYASETFGGKGVNAYFYDPRIKEYVNLEIADFYIGNSFEGVYWKTAFDGNGLCLTTDLYYASQEWTSSVRDIGDSKIESAPLPDTKGRLVIFPEPTVVSEKFYNLFKAISDTSEDIFGEGYADGVEKGKAEGIAEGIEQGKKSQYDEFWDDLQDGGARTTYSYVFRFYSDKTFYPKYDINVIGNGNAVFASNKITDLTARLQECGVTLDTSKATSLAESFAYSPNLTRVPIVSCVSAGSTAYIFCNDYALAEVEKLILKSDGSQSFSSAFVNCNALITLNIEGVIGKGDLNLQWSTKLSKASITSIINCLSTTTSGLSVTLSRTAVESAFGSTDSAEWTTLIGTRSNWTINLI